MRTSGRLAVVLQSIVVSSLSACGGAADGGHSAITAGGAGGAAGGTGGSASGGRASAGDGAGGQLQAGGIGGAFIIVNPSGTGGTATAGSGGAAIGGQGTAGSPLTPTMPTCDDKGLLSFVDGLNLPEPVDYIGIYLNQGTVDATLYQSKGTACGMAIDEAKCKAALVSGAPLVGFGSLYLQNTPSPLPLYNYMYVAYTRGESVGFISQTTQLISFLGEIDTANEAGLMFLSMGFPPGCNMISETKDAYFFATQSVSVGCPVSPPGRLFSVTRAGDGVVTTIGTAMPCVGRRPEGLREPKASRANPLGDYYASIAYLEAAAVLAFEVMESELARFGAPAHLRAGVRRARCDEQRHAKQMADFAKRWDGSVPPAEVTAPIARSVLDAALENAVEGCVREAWGALSAHYQAATARDPEARRLWRGIAADESEHAELSLAVHEWYLSQLAPDERALVESAIQRARLELRVELASAGDPDAAVIYGAGVPDPARAAALFGELETQVLAA